MDLDEARGKQRLRRMGTDAPAGDDNAGEK